MAAVNLRFVKAYKDRHGRLRHYFRQRGRASVTLPGLPGSAEFMAAYQAALKEAPALLPGASRVAAWSFDALAVAYYSSAGFVTLAPSTQATYRGVIDRFRSMDVGGESVGNCAVNELRREHVRKLMDRKAEQPAAANALLKMLRILMAFAVERGWRRDDPTTGVRNVRSKAGGFHTWTEGEIEAFEAAHPSGSRARLALALLLYTAQRRGDVVRLGRQHVRDGKLSLRQEKTGTALTIPVHPRLQAEIDRLPAGQLTFLQTAYGKPMTPAGFTNWFRDCAVAAGLPSGCSPHGLRKAASRRLAEAGCSASVLASVTGHRTLKEVARYTAAADQEGLASLGIAALSRAEA